MSIPSLLKFASAGVFIALAAWLFAALLFPPAYQSVDTSKWPQEAIDIAMENHPHGAMTPDQFRRLDALNEEMKFRLSLSEILWMDVLDRWWFFVVLILASSAYLHHKKNFSLARLVLLSTPSVLVLLFATVAVP